MGKRINPYLGRWRIIEMEMWNQDYIDLVTEGNFIFGEYGIGNFEFGAIKAETDYSIEKVGNTERVDFSFEGYDEYDPVSGRGWVIIENDTLAGKFFFIREMTPNLRPRKPMQDSTNNLISGSII